MKIISLCLFFLLASYVPSIHAKSYIGTLVADEYPEGVYRSWRYGVSSLSMELVKKVWMVHRVTHHSKPYFWFSRYHSHIEKEGCSANRYPTDCLEYTYIVLDEIELPTSYELPAGFELSTSYDECGIDRVMSNTIHAVVASDGRTGFNNHLQAVKAWEIDFQNNKFVEIPAADVYCIYY